MLEEIKDKDGNIIAKKNQLIDKEASIKIEHAGPETVRIRSLIACKTKDGVCRMCYGHDLSKNTAGGYGSAKDIAILLLDIVKNKPSLMETSRLIEIDINSRKFKNTDQIVNFLSGFVAGKTGFSDLAGGNLAVVVDIGYQHPLVIVVLGSTLEGRFSDVITLYQAAISDIINL